MWFLIFGVIVIGLALLWPTAKYEEGRTGRMHKSNTLGIPKVFKLTAAIVGLVLVGFSFFTTVPARNYGVVTTFSKPTGRVLEAGAHFKLPWQKVTDMDGTIQQINNDGTPNDEDKNEVSRARGKTEVRLNNQSVMYVENIVRWRIRSEAADQLFVDWKEFKNIDPGLVSKEVNAALNVALADYDPYVPASSAPSKDDLAREVLDRLVGPDTKNPETNGKGGQIGNQIEVISFSIVKVDFDQTTQDYIQRLQEEVANTKRATQEKATAEQRRLAAEELSSSSAIRDPGVLTSRCLDIQQLAVERGQGLAGAPSCVGGDQASRIVTPPANQ